MNTDPVSDMLSRIRNAVAVNHVSVSMPYSRLKFQLAEELAREKFVAEVKPEGEGTAKTIVIRLRDEDEPNRITEIQRVSKPGRRLYANAKSIPRVMNGRGVMIVSTSSGLMTDREARAKGNGGELICKVY